MKGKDSNDYFDLNNIEIEYNEDFDSTKTKSLTKFPNKNKEFSIDNVPKNFSKSLNFNSRQCYAPKIKYKKINKKPSPIFFKKIPNKYTMKTQCEAISEDLLSEKESSLVSEDSSSDYVIDNLDSNNNNENNENKVTNEENNNPVKKSIDDIIDSYKQEKEFKSDMKLYEHKSIGIFPYQCYKDKQNKNNIKFFRNNLHKIKIRFAQLKNKEQEFTLKNSLKKKYRLDLIINNKKANINNEYSVIPINNNDNSDSDDDSCDMSNLRGTISYNQSKQKKEKKDETQKIVNIYEVLRKSVKNKK